MEKNERTCQSSGLPMLSHNSSCRKVRSSRTNAGNPPPLALDELTLRHEELCDYMERYYSDTFAQFFVEVRAR